VTVSALLDELRSRDIKVWADGELLRCSAPAGALTADLRSLLQSRKHEILGLLRSAKTLSQQYRAIIPLQPHGTRTPVFGVAGHNGDVFCYRAMVQQLGDEQPFFGLQPPGLNGNEGPLTSVEDLAAHFASQIRGFSPDGPYVVAGYCAGGAIAFEVARQLVREGAVVEFLALFGSPYPTWYRFLPQLRRRLELRVRWVHAHAKVLASLSYAEGRSYIAEKLRARKAQRDAAHNGDTDPALVVREQVGKVTLAAIRKYTPQFFPGRVVMFLPSEEWLRNRTGRLLRWRSMAMAMDIQCGPPGCPSDEMLLEPHVVTNAELFRRCCDESVQRAREPAQASRARSSMTRAATKSGAGDQLSIHQPR
jgi:thioesterase domain-containing protein